MKIKNVYADIVKYHSANAFKINLPAEQPENKTLCTEHVLTVEEADRAADVLWNLTSSEKVLQSELGT